MWTLPLHSIVTLIWISCNISSQYTAFHILRSHCDKSKGEVWTSFSLWCTWRYQVREVQDLFSFLNFRLFSNIFSVFFTVLHLLLSILHLYWLFFTIGNSPGWYQMRLLKKMRVILGRYYYLPLTAVCTDWIKLIFHFIWGNMISRYWNSTFLYF